MVGIGHVIEHFLRVDRQDTKMIIRAVDPVRRIPLVKIWRIIMRLVFLRIMPHHDCAHDFPDNIGLDVSGFWTRAVIARDVVYFAVRSVPPAMVGAADRVALDLFLVRRYRSSMRCGEMRTHVLAVSVETDNPAALTTIECEVLAKETDRQRAVVQLLCFGNHEPSTRKGERSQLIFACSGHNVSVSINVCWLPSACCYRATPW